MAEADSKVSAREYLLPHTYVGNREPARRTCAVCGRGANAEVHKT